MIKGEYRGEPFEAVHLEAFQTVLDLRLLDVIRKIVIYTTSSPLDDDPDDEKEQTLKTIIGHIGAMDELLDERIEANSPSSEDS
jgi:hypothetical protein